ncbi:uncharacterized protein V1518DRAFT_417423 [Limtongia smithiae]|uniref:uncharacterized protein n=1 Tax=Limtongia smithiae TaxID=1125753 RepID=UPI0034CF08C7
MISQVIRFTLPATATISAAAFAELRRHAVTAGALAQYYGYTQQVPNAPMPRKRHEICWAINWPRGSDRSIIMEELAAIAADAMSLDFQFPEGGEFKSVSAFEAPVCEFACIRLSDTAPLDDVSLQKSMNKTFADTHKIIGFTGGSWAYALNTNDSSGVSVSDIASVLPAGERRLAVYPLGWESIELHQDGTKTPVFAEELDKIGPYFGPGSGAWYVSFKKHSE